MNPLLESFIYPFLFITLFFEVFAILTFFDAEARRRRSMTPSALFPSIAVIIPCYNEEATIQGSVDSLLALDYPADKLSIIVADDGSTDRSREVLLRYATHPQVSLIRKENGGKHTALNAGIASTSAEFVGCLDGDSFVMADALKEIVPHFDDARVGAVTASMSVHEPRSALERMQQAEYLIGIAFRHVISTVNGLHVAPGPFTFYRRSMFAELGPFRSAHQTEDMEIALRMQKAGWKIRNAPRARVFTRAPKTVGSLVKQRTRWTTGFIRNGFDYRDLFGNPKYEALGLIILPWARSPSSRVSRSSCSRSTSPRPACGGSSSTSPRSRSPRPCMSRSSIFSSRPSMSSRCSPSSRSPSPPSS